MAGLPENSEYNVQGVPSSAGIISKNLGVNFSQPGLIKNITQSLQNNTSSGASVPQMGMPRTGNGILDFITSGRSFSSGASMSGATMDPGYDLFTQGAFNVEGPLAAYEGSRMPIPEGYQFRDQAPSADAYILNFQNGGGQMVVDPNNRGAIFKSARDPMGGSTASSVDRQLALGNRPSSLFQIDHIIPLWLGGADTDYNKETISIAKHLRKTKVQAIPYTLLRKGLITPDEARKWAMNWENLDYRDIPDPSNESGQLGEIPLQFAKDKLALWKKHREEGFNPNIKTPGLFETMRDPEFAKGLGERIIPGDGPIVDTLQEIYKGAASAMTFGWVPYVPDDDANGAQKAIGVIANAGISMLPVLALGKLATSANLAKKTGIILKNLAKVGWVAAGPGKVTGAVTLGAKASTSLGPKAATGALSLGKGSLLNVTRPFYKDVAKSATKFKELALKYSFMKSDPEALKMMKQVGLGAILYGQLGPQGIAGAAAGEEDAEPFERFVEDFVYSGVALFAKPGLRGLPATMATPLALGSTIDVMKGDELNTQEWVTTSLLMGGLHMFGSPAMRRRVDFINQEIEKGLSVNAYTKVSSFVSEKSLPPLVEGKAVPRPREYVSLEQAERKEISLWNEAKENLSKMRNEGGIDDASMAMELSDIKKSLHQLKKTWVSPEDRRSLDIEDIDFTLETIKNGQSILPNQMGKSTAVTRLKSLLTKEDLDTIKAPDLPTLKKDEVPKYSRSEAGNISGRITLTGPGVTKNGKLDVLGENTRNYQEAVQKGEASPVLIAVERSDLAPTIKEINATYTIKDIEEGFVRPSQNPQNVMQVYGAFFDPKGGVYFKIVGYVPRKFAISEKKLAQNSNANRPFKNDPDLNKDTLTEELRGKGFKFLALSYDELNSAKAKYKYLSVISEKPYLSVMFGDANWERSKILNEKYFAKIRDEKLSANSMTELIVEAKNAVGEAKKVYVDKINNILKNDNLAADDVLLAAGKETAFYKNAEAASAFFSDARRSLESASSPTQVKENFKERLTIDLTPEEARSLFLQKEQLSVSQLLRITDIALKENRIGEKSLVYEGFVKPFLRSNAFVRWGMADVFLDLKIVGNPSAKRSLPMLGGVEKVPDGPVSRDTAPSSSVPPQKGTQEVPINTPPIEGKQSSGPIQDILEFKKGDRVIEKVIIRDGQYEAGVADPEHNTYGVVVAKSDRTGGVGIKFDGDRSLTWIDSRSLGGASDRIQYFKAPQIQQKTQVAPPERPTGQPIPAEKPVTESIPGNILPPQKSTKLAATIANKATNSPIIQNKLEMPKLDGDLSLTPLPKDTQMQINSPQGATTAQKTQGNVTAQELAKRSAPVIDEMVEATRRADGKTDKGFSVRKKVSEDAHTSQMAKIGDYQETQKKIISQKLKEIEFTKRSGEGSYATRLKATAESSVPTIDQLPREFPLAEKKFIIDHLRNNARLLAYETFSTKIPAEPRVSFAVQQDGKRITKLQRSGGKSGSLPKHSKDEIEYENLIRVQEAIDRDFFGVHGGYRENDKTKITSLEYAKSKLGEKETERALKILRAENEDLLSTKTSKKEPKIDKKDVEKAKIVIAEKNIKDFIDDKLLEKEGTYFKTFASTVDTVMTKSLGKDWRNDIDVLKVFGATVDPKTGRYPEESLFGQIFAPKRGTTQPDDVLRLKAEGRHRQAKAAEASRKEENILQDIERANRRASQKAVQDEWDVRRDDLGAYSDEAFSTDDLERLSFVSENQSDAFNFPEESAFDSVFVGFSDYLRKVSRGEKAFLSPANGITDATSFLYGINRALKKINPQKSLSLQHENVRGSISEILKKLKGKHKITDKSLVDLYQEGNNLTDLIEHNQDEAAEIMEKQLVPLYKEIQKLAALAEPKNTTKKFSVPSNPAEAKKAVERFSQKGLWPVMNAIRKGESPQKPLSPKQLELYNSFDNILDKYKKVTDAIHEDTLRREILRADALGKKKGLSAAEISKLLEKRPRPPEFY
jgi:hypothetical protein